MAHQISGWLEMYNLPFEDNVFDVYTIGFGVVMLPNARALKKHIGIIETRRTYYGSRVFANSSPLGPMVL